MEHSVPLLRNYFLMGQVSFLRAPGKRCFILQLLLKKEDGVWTSAESSEDEGDFAPDKQVSFTVHNRCLVETIVPFSPPL